MVKILTQSYFIVMVCSRCDLQHVSFVDRYMVNQRKEHWEEVKWILRHLKATMNVGLVFDRNIAKHNNVVGYVDSDYVDDPYKRSLSGYNFTLFNSAISWKMSLQSIIALSTTKA